MNKIDITSERLGESYQKIVHPSGLTILLYPMQGFVSAYAVIATDYGSVDETFKTDSDADFISVPAGVAHFLEHKLFENEEGDAFIRYAKTGASANAFTSFDKTAYLFSCTDKFAESLDILLDFVSRPYFTPETVAKEQGIIGQEIKMYEDSPDWRVYFNLLEALYHNNPVRLDIAGTVDSISEIDAELLYRCYNTFYNLRNMTLVVAGNFDPEIVVAAADKHLKPAPEQTIIRDIPHEPDEVREKLITQNLPVAQPIFQVGFKGPTGKDGKETTRGQITDEVLGDILAGEASPLYKRLFEEGLINQSFSVDSMAGRGYSIIIYAGESREPEKVRDALLEEIKLLAERGIGQAEFERCKKAAYGRYLGMYGRPDALGGLLMNMQFAGCDAYTAIEILASLTLEQINARLKTALNPEHCALSVVRAA